MKLGSAFFGQWIDGLYSVVNDYGIAIILITIGVRLVLLPLNLKQRKTTDEGENGCILPLRRMFEFFYLAISGSLC